MILAPAGVLQAFKSSLKSTLQPALWALALVSASYRPHNASDVIDGDALASIETGGPDIIPMGGPAASSLTSILIHIV